MKILPFLFPLGALVHLQVANGEATAAASSALSALKSIDFRYFVAGGTCAAISHGMTTPIDVTKTRIQADPSKFNKGMISAAMTILKEDGAHVLLGGLGPTVVGYGIEGELTKYRGILSVFFCNWVDSMSHIFRPFNPVRCDEVWRL